MKKSTVFLLFFVLCCYASLFAQTRSGKTDSLLIFQVLSTDTSALLPSSKTVNVYSPDDKLTERRIFFWEKKSNKWIQRKRFTLHHFANEILVDCFHNEGNKQEILTGRMSVLLNAEKNITECSIYEKERYTDRYHLLRKLLFVYRKDTLLHQEEFVQGTTFYRKSEMNRLFGENSIQLTTKQFDETGRTIGSAQREMILHNNKVIRHTSKTDTNKAVQIDSMYYQHDTLVATCHCTQNTEKEHIAVALYTEKFLYRPNGTVDILMLYHDANRKPLTDNRNTLKRYSTAKFCLSDEFSQPQILLNLLN